MFPPLFQAECAMHYVDPPKPVFSIQSTKLPGAQTVQVTGQAVENEREVIFFLQLKNVFIK